MENRTIKHVSRHRVAYLIAAVLVTVGGFSFRQSVPDFYALDNSALTGNLGEISNTSNSVQMLNKDLGSKVLLSGEQVTLQWKSNSDVADLYLVPENRKQTSKAIKKSIMTHEENGVRSYTWQVPSNVASGVYNVGVHSNKKLAVTDLSFTVIQTGNKADGGLSALNAQTQSMANDIQSYQTQLATINNKITEKNNNLLSLKSEVQTANTKLNANISNYKSIKNTLSVTENKARALEIYALNITLNQRNVALKSTQAELITLQAEAKAFEAKIASSQAKVAALSGKIAEIKGVKELNMNATLDTKNSMNFETTPTLNLNATEKPSDMKVQLSDLTLQISSKEASITELKLQVEKAKIELEAAQNELTVSQKAAETASNEVNSLSVSLEKAKKTVTEITNKISAAQERSTVESLQKELESAQVEVASLGEKLAAAQTRQTASMNKLSSGLRVVSEKEQAGATIQLSLATAETELTTLNASKIQLELKNTEVKNQALQTKQSLSNGVSTETTQTQEATVTGDLTVNTGSNETDTSAEETGVTEATIESTPVETTRSTPSITSEITAQ